MQCHSRLLVLACVMGGLLASATALPGVAQQRVVVPSVIVPGAPVIIGQPDRRTHGDLTWSTTGRADVNVSVERRHSQALAP
jgi:hypothetical protein